MESQGMLHTRRGAGALLGLSFVVCMLGVVMFALGARRGAQSEDVCWSVVVAQGDRGTGWAGSSSLSMATAAGAAPIIHKAQMRYLSTYLTSIVCTAK